MAGTKKSRGKGPSKIRPASSAPDSVMLIVLLAGALTWGSTLGGSFHYDDVHSIVDNIHVRMSGLDTGLIAAYLTEPATFSVDPDKAMYRPFLVSSFAANHAANLGLDLSGYHVVGYHVVNVGLHLGCALLVMWLVVLLGGSQRARLLAGLLFAVHPVASEPVNYISSRSESLSVLCYLLAVCLFLHAERANVRWRLGVWVAMAAGLLSKSTVITLPAALLLLDLLVLSGRDVQRVARRLVSHHLVGWLVALGYLAVVSSNGWLGRSLSQDVRAPMAQAMTQLKAVVYYLALLATPLHQSVEPQFVEQAHVGAVVAAAWLLIASLAVLLVWLLRNRCGRAVFLLGWACLHLLPTLVVPLNVFVNERRAYGPLAIACVGVGLLLSTVRLQRYRGALVVVACALLGLLSVQRSQVWEDEFSLWSDAVHKAPRMSRAHLYLGNTYKDAAQHEQDQTVRIPHWRAADAAFAQAYVEARVLDMKLRALNNRGGVRFAMFNERRGSVEGDADLATAEELFNASVEHNPMYADAIINLGNVKIVQARSSPDPQRRQDLLRQGIARLARALEIQPNHHQAHTNLGVAYQDLGETARAERHYRQALYLVPGDWLTRKNLASVLYQLAESDVAAGRVPAAQARLREGATLVRQALQMNPAVSNGRQVMQTIDTQLRALEQAGRQ